MEQKVIINLADRREAQALLEKADRLYKRAEILSRIARQSEDSAIGIKDSVERHQRLRDSCRRATPHCIIVGAAIGFAIGCTATILTAPSPTFGGFGVFLLLLLISAVGSTTLCALLARYLVTWRASWHDRLCKEQTQLLRERYAECTVCLSVAADCFEQANHQRELAAKYNR